MVLDGVRLDWTGLDSEVTGDRLCNLHGCVKDGLKGDTEKSSKWLKLL